jgi:hypothetical protein
MGWRVGLGHGAVFGSNGMHGIGEMGERIWGDEMDWDQVVGWGSSGTGGSMC